MSHSKPKLAKNLKAPQKLTDEEIKKALDEGAEIGKILSQKLKNMSVLTVEERCAIVGGPNCICRKKY